MWPDLKTAASADFGTPGVHKRRNRAQCAETLRRPAATSGYCPREPTGNLDEDNTAEIMGILKECAHEMQKCVIVVTHSNDLAKQADVICRLKKGELHIPCFPS